MKRSSRIALYIILAILFILFIICLKNKTIEGLTNYPSNFCTIVKKEDVCQTNWQTRDYFTKNPTTLIQGQNPCSWNITTSNPNGICQNSTFANGWGFTFTGPPLT